MANIARLRFASLFCGCGGFDLGFVRSGFKLVAAFDNDRDAIATHRLNLGGIAELRDLTDTREPVKIPSIDVLVAGPPCQGFSTMGRMTPDDPRNNLLLAAGHMAARARPLVVAVENVPAVCAGRHRAHWDSLKALLHSAQYQTKEILCEGTKLGIPQTRKRLVLFGWRTKSNWLPPLPTLPQVHLADALRGLRGMPNHTPRMLEPSTIAYRVSSLLRPGQKLSNVRGGPHYVATWDLPTVFGRTSKAERKVLEAIRSLRRRDRLRCYGDADPVTLASLENDLATSVEHTLFSLIEKGFVRKVGRRYDLTRTFNGKFHRLDPHEPAPTVDTKFGDPRLVLHPRYNRGLTVREAARIQGLPDSFVLLGSEKSQFRLVGNAVPPTFGAAIAQLALAAVRTPAPHITR